MLIGGGEVFCNACPSDPTWPLLRYCGDFVAGHKVLAAYGAAFDPQALPNDPALRSAAGQLLRRFDRITLDASPQNLSLAEQLCGQSAEYAPDPIWLLPAASWQKLAAGQAVPQHDYLACMCSAEPRGQQGLIQAPALRCLPLYNLNWERSIASRPRSVCQWLALIMHAALIISDDFYCLALALILHRPCIALIPPADGLRVHDLFTVLGLEHCLQSSLAQLSTADLQVSISWKQTEHHLQKMHARARRILQEILALQPTYKSAYIPGPAVLKARRAAEQRYTLRSCELRRRLSLAGTQQPLERYKMANSYLDEVLDEHCLPLYYAPAREGERGNAGDLPSRYIVETLSGHRVIMARADSPHKLCAVGSIIWNEVLCGGGHYWGSGTQLEHLVRAPGNVFHAVRDPLTRRILLQHGYTCPDVYGDPALLLPRLYPCRPSHRYKLGLICHFLHRHQLNVAADVLCINIMCQEWNLCSLIDDICACDMILSSSLHGIIIAHAYGIAAQWFILEGHQAEAPLKYWDYFLAVGMPCQQPLVLNCVDEVSERLVRHCARSVDLHLDLQRLADAFPYAALPQLLT